MTATTNSGGPRRVHTWWSHPGNRNKVWLGLLAAALVVLVGMLVVLRSSGDGDAPMTSGSQPSLYRFETTDVHALAFDPSNELRLLFGHHGGVMSSDDAGRSWRDLVNEPDFDGMNVVFDPQRASSLYVAGHNIFSRSEDGGETWQPVSSNLPGLDLHAFAASPHNPGRFYAFAGGQGLFVSEDGVSSWRPLWPDAPPGTHSLVETTGGTLVLGAADRGILRSEDGGGSWDSSRDGIEDGVIFTVKGDPTGTRLYAGTSVGLFASLDSGRSWSATALDDTMVISVAVNPADGLNVMAIGRDGSLYRSTDGGATWAE
jgi:photosystem II stability/assembly factor-like uncharacterized protein